MITKEDSQIIDEVFKVLDKAKFDGIDANDILKFGMAMKRLAQLQTKLNELIEQPEKEVTPPPKKAKKDATK